MLLQHQGSYRRHIGRRGAGAKEVGKTIAIAVEPEESCVYAIGAGDLRDVANLDVRML